MISPEVAKKYLAVNGENPRKLINKNVVHQYAIDMATGNWVLNGEPLVFDSNGNLKNGQHRLTAVIQADVTVPMMVIRGVDPAIGSFDYGYRRRINQEKNVTRAVESISTVMVTNCYSVTNIPKGLQGEYIDEHCEELKRAELIAGTGELHARAKKRDIMTAVYLLLRTGTDEETLRSFFTVVNSGFQLDDRESSSAIVLRKFIDTCKARKNRDSIMRNMCFVILAFKDFINGVRRRKAYIVNDTSMVRAMFDDVREMDGLLF